ncbi:MAG: chorismate synthase [candidate division Zixibacteria bacterium]|nr:chorismate synthase [candidate division Zixibacteria bacterium]
MPQYITAGESHGQGLVALIESFPAGIPISLKEINHQMFRRQQGFGRGQRMKIEADKVKILSGIRNSKTLGSPISMFITNKDWVNWRKIMHPDNPVSKKLSPAQKKRAYDVTAPRPGHTDLAGAIKYDTKDLRNVLERSSARETAARVACGSVARQLLEQFSIKIASHVISIGKGTLKKKKLSFDDIYLNADSSPVRCVNKEAEKSMIDAIKEARKKQDTLGGVFEVRITGLPIGLGGNAQWYNRLDANLAQAFMSIQSVKGVEIGEAFTNAAKFGSQVHDSIYFNEKQTGNQSKGFWRKTNAAGGIEGGLSNGADIIIRAACKPISTLMKPLNTIDVKSKKDTLAMIERSDICVIPAAAVVGEAMAAMVVSECFLNKFGGDSFNEIRDNFRGYLEREF